MRRVIAGLFAIASLAAAQDPAAAPAPAAPKGPKRAEFRVGGIMIAGERSYDVSNPVQTATGSIKGVEVLLRGSGIGLYVRSLSGTFGKQPQVISADARLLLFPPSFTIFGGVGKRGLSSSLGTNVKDFAMAGVSSTITIGGTGVRTHMSVAALVAPDKSSSTTPSTNKPDPSTGLEGEAALFWRMPRAPLFLSIGYRTEVFTSKSSTLETPEEVRGLRIGAGLQFGGH